MYTILFIFSVVLTPIYGSGLRIINGTNTEENGFPFVVTILYESDILLCMGNILNEKYVLTAAHCVYNLDIIECPSKFKVLYGKTHLHDDKDLRDNVVQVKYIHTLTFDYNRRMNDLAILELENPLPSNSTWRSAKLSKSILDEETAAVIVGWSPINEYTKIPEHLEKIDVIIYDPIDCHISLLNNYNNQFLCFGREIYGGACYGDSGAPLIDNKGTLVGIISSVNTPCGTNNRRYPSIAITATKN